MSLKCSNNAQCFCLTKMLGKNASIMYKSLDESSTVGKNWPFLKMKSRTLLHMLSSSTCCRERENRWFAVQQWTWVNLLVFLPPKSTLMKKNFISIAYSNFNVFVVCIVVLKTPEKAPPASRIEMFLFVIICVEAKRFTGQNDAKT